MFWNRPNCQDAINWLPVWNGVFQVTFPLKLGFEYHLFHFFDSRSIAVEVGVLLYNNLSCMLSRPRQVKWRQSTTHPNGSKYILFLGTQYDKMPIMHVIGNAKSMCEGLMDQHIGHPVDTLPEALHYARNNVYLF